MREKRRKLFHHQERMSDSLVYIRQRAPAWPGNGSQEAIVALQEVLVDRLSSVSWTVINLKGKDHQDSLSVQNSGL